MALESPHLTIYRVRHVVITDCENYRGRQRHHVHNKVLQDPANICRVEMKKYARTHAKIHTHR